MNFSIRTIVFDLDGTLVDSKLDFDQMRKNIGIPDNEPLLEYIEKVNQEDFTQKAFEIIDRHELKGAQVATPLKDADEFIKFLNCKRIPIHILTRNSSKVTQLTLSRFDWKFEEIFTRDNAAAKPNPDALIQILTKYSLRSCELLYIGDFEFDLLTAQNANCISGLFVNEKNKHLSDKADIVIESFMSLKKYFE